MLQREMPVFLDVYVNTCVDFLDYNTRYRNAKAARTAILMVDVENEFQRNVSGSVRLN